MDQAHLIPGFRIERVLGEGGFGIHMGPGMNQGLAKRDAVEQGTDVRFACQFALRHQ